MIKLLLKLLDSISQTILFCAGIWLLYITFFNADQSNYLWDTLKATKSLRITIGLFFLLIVLVRFEIRNKNSTKGQYIDLQTDDGQIGISIKAICDFISRIGKEFPAIKQIETKVKNHKSTIAITLLVKIKAGNKIPELSKQLKYRVRESAQESLGIEEISSISIKIREITGNPPPSKKNSDPAIPKAEKEPISEEIS